VVSWSFVYVVSVCCVVCSCNIIICVEGILDIKLGTLRGRVGWVCGMRNVHIVICIRWARHVAYTKLIKEHSKYLLGISKIMQRVGELAMTLDSNNSPQSSFSSAALLSYL